MIEYELVDVEVARADFSFRRAKSQTTIDLEALIRTRLLRSNALKFQYPKNGKIGSFQAAIRKAAKEVKVPVSITSSKDKTHIYVMRKLENE